MLAPVPTPRLPLLARAAVVAALFAACAAQAHDTWLQVAPQQPGAGLLALQLGSGGRYPKSEGVVPGARVARSGCIDEPVGLAGLVDAARAGDARARDHAFGLRIAPARAELQRQQARPGLLRRDLQPGVVRLDCGRSQQGREGRGTGEEGKARDRHGRKHSDRRGAIRTVR